MKRTRALLAEGLFALLVLAALPYSGAQAACAIAAIDPGLCSRQMPVSAGFDSDRRPDLARAASADPTLRIEIQLGLTGLSIAQPDDEGREQPFEDEANSPVALEVNSHRIQPRAPAALNDPHHQGVLPLGVVRRTTSRGPPSLLI